MSNVLYIGICGKARAGKDTFASMLAGNLYDLAKDNKKEGTSISQDFTIIRSLADPLREMVMVLLQDEGTRKELLGGDKKEESIAGLNASPRKLLQTLGTEWGRDMIDEDLWIHVLKRRTASFIDNATQSDRRAIIIVPDIRFENEAKFVDMLFQVIRDDVPVVRDHESEAGIPPHYITRTITNNGTLEALDKKALGAATEVMEST